MGSRLQLQARFTAASGELFEALLVTIAFRRWPGLVAEQQGATPDANLRYRHRFGSVLRVGRVVEVIRPVGCSLREVLHDPPCRVGLRIRWRIEPVQDKSLLRLQLHYRCNHAAFFRRDHWDARLEEHFRRQFAFVARNLERVRLNPARLSGTDDTQHSQSRRCKDSQAYRDAG